MPNGEVLVTGGYNETNGSLADAELYDPATGSWTSTGALDTARYAHSAILLPGGKVLVAGGVAAANDAELYEPANGTWTVTGAPAVARFLHTATLLPDGKVLIAGGYGSSGITGSAELYDAGLGQSNAWQPQIASVTSPLSLGDSLVLTGAEFRGIAEGSGGDTQDSSADYPLVQLRSIESGQTLFLSSTNWGTDSFTSLPVWKFPPGEALATVFVNGIPGASCFVNISIPIPQPPILTGPAILDDGTFQFTFTNSVGALFGVLATTDLSLPTTNWTVLGGVVEVSPGRFQFTDPQATNNPQRFYLIRSP